MREYERCSTTAIDAYLSPLLGRYLGRLGEAAAAAPGCRAPLVMQSSGGVAATAEAARGGRLERPLRPGRAARSAPPCSPEPRGDGNAIGLDMGGTSCDVCVVEDGEVRRTDSREIDGRTIQLPMVDVHTVGAGGGSIGWRDRGGALRVGPRSAGADPGPACYGRGGAEPTVTDANLLLGNLAADSRLAGGVALDVDAAARRGRRARPSRSASARSRPRRGSSGSPTRRWCAPCEWSPSSEASTRAASPCSPSAAPARCTRPRSPPSSASGAILCPRAGGVSRRSASARRTAAATPPAP